MAVGTINPVDPRTATGAAPVAAAATVTDGDNIPMLPGRTYMVVINNGSGAGITADINDPASGAGVVEYNDVAIGAGASRAFAFKRPLFGKTPTENVNIICSAVTSVTINAWGPLDSNPRS